MDKNKSAVEAFLEGDSNENMFANPTKDPFEAVVSEGDEPSVEEPKEEKPLPFHKDPKVQRFIDKEIEKRLKDIQPNEPEKKSETDEDDYYARLIGNDTPEKVAMIKEAKARDERLLSQAEERAFNRLSAKEQEALQEDQEAEEELGNAFENIEETYDVDITSNSPQARKVRQDFVSFVERIAPKNSYGEVIDYPDMNSAWETYSEMKRSTAQPSRAKELASRGMSRSAETSVKDTKKVDWNAVEEFMDTLK